MKGLVGDSPRTYEGEIAVLKERIRELEAQLNAALTVAGAGGFKDQSDRIRELESACRALRQGANKYLVKENDQLSQERDRYRAALEARPKPVPLGDTATVDWDEKYHEWDQQAAKALTGRAAQEGE